MASPIPNALSGLQALQALQLNRGTPPSLSTALASLAGQDLELWLQAILPEGVQLQLPTGQSILAQGQLPYPPGTRLLVRILPNPDEGGVRLQTLEARPPSTPGILAPLLQGEAASLLGRLSQGEPGLLPLLQLAKQLAGESSSAQDWELWIRASLKTLGDPALSPREAPLHIAQAMEKTAFFEIPLPWPSAGNLQIWVESELPEEGAAQPEAIQRVLLGLQFSGLGETRLGLAKGPFGLQVRVWAEHPEALQAERARMEAELRDLGAAVDLQIRPLPEGTPSLHAMVTGPTLQALG